MFKQAWPPRLPPGVVLEVGLDCLGPRLSGCPDIVRHRLRFLDIGTFAVYSESHEQP